MSYLKEYEKWLNSDTVDKQTNNELLSIKKDENEIKSRFSCMLQFGTAGLRGILGAGLNRMNIYTVRYATQGLANLISENGEIAKKRGVVIAYDCRIMSREFSEEVSCVLAANGIKSYLFDELRPTPELSFAIRQLNCIAGVNITASHNPKQYNGYKAYWEDGAQLSPENAKVVLDEIVKADIFDDVKTVSFETALKDGFVTEIGQEIDELFLDKVLEQSINSQFVKDLGDNFKVVYTPFHGTGYKLVPEILKRIGLKKLYTVESQMLPDGNFPTVKSPNPEEKEGFLLAIELAKKENIDIILATDPDADRVGLVGKNSSGEYIVFSGNQIGVILLNYIITARKENNSLPKNACVIKTIVTSELATEICKQNGISIVNVLTGFKFIGEKIKEWEKTDEHSFIFGYEESYGYLSGTYARDKDAVFASMLLTEAAAYYQSKGMTLYDALMSIYDKYGYFKEKTISITMDGLDGLEKTKKLMSTLREEIACKIDGVNVKFFKDYKSGIVTELSNGNKSETNLPVSDVIYYELEEKSVIVVRPSGTEPKVKVYLMVSGINFEECEIKISNFEKHFKDLL